MEITYQNTGQDYKEFYKFNYKKQLPARLFVILLFAIFSISDAFKHRNLIEIIVGLIVYFTVIASFVYFIPYFIVSIRIKRSIVQKGLLEQKSLSVTNEGLKFTLAGNSIFYAWASIKSLELTDGLIFIHLSDRKFFIIPKREFSSETEVSYFLDYLQNNAPNLSWAAITKPKAPYSIGWLGLIPLVGGFIGIWLIISGILKYKDKKLILIGGAGLAFNIVIYSSLYFVSQSNFEKKGFIPFAQNDLNTLMKCIEFYKLQNGTYPDSLAQVTSDNKFISIHDPVQKGASEYNYQKVGNKYYLFSSGPDGIPNTKDDIYPNSLIKDSTKIGLLKH